MPKSDQRRAELTERRRQLENQHDNYVTEHPETTPDVQSHPAMLMRSLAIPRASNQRGQAVSRIQAVQNLQRSLGNQAVQNIIQRKAKKHVGVTNFSIDNTTYPIEAETLSEVVDVLEGREEAGKTTWEPFASYELDEEGTVTKSTVDVSVTIEMPDWPNAASLKGGEKKQWTNFKKALTKHEKHHHTLVKTHLKGVAKKMKGTEAEADVIFQEKVTALQTASDEYDDTTDHGIKEGAIIEVEEPAEATE